MESNTANNVFTRSWSLVRANPIVVAPAAVLGLLSGFVAWALTPHLETHTETAAIAGALYGKFIWWFVAVAAAVATMTYTTGMAEALWMRGTATLADGWLALREDVLGAVAAFLIWIILGAGAAILGPFALYIPLIAFAFFTAYLMPAIVVGRLEPFKALSESFNLAWNYPVNTTVMIVGVGFAWLLAVLASALLGDVPVLGPLAAGLIACLVLAYATVVFVGEYIEIRGPRPLFPKA